MSLTVQQALEAAWRYVIVNCAKVICAASKDEEMPDRMIEGEVIPEVKDDAEGVGCSAGNSSNMPFVTSAAAR